MMFNGWRATVETVIAGVFAYVALIVLLRISGKRTLGKMNAFDFVVTIALGSTLSTVLLSRDVALIDGVVAMALLIGLQYVTAWTSVREPRFERLVKSSPTLLLYRGQLCRGDMKRQRVSEEEIRSAVRNAGLAGFEEARAVVLETDGTFSVIRSDAVPGGEALVPLVRHG